MPLDTSAPEADSGHSPVIEDLEVEAYEIPTATGDESDGTLIWSSTTLVLVRPRAGGRSGLGYTYADRATAVLIRDVLAGVVRGRPALDIPSAHVEMTRSCRNLGRAGIVSMAIAAVDNSLWDLKGRLLGTSLLDLLGASRSRIPTYGSGGFTSYSESQLREQLEQWASRGFRAVKMKVGRDPDQDIARVRLAREAIGDDIELYVDANGAYDRKQALAFAGSYGELGVRWFEEPVTSDDLEGLHLLRDRTPGNLRIAAGEYGYDLLYFQRMLDAGAVDVLQADATRCEGISGFIKAAVLAEANSVQFSAHTAPTLHGQLACAIPVAWNVEYFFDHQRIETIFFDGALEARDGYLEPDRSRPGLGIDLKASDAETYRIEL